MMESQLVKFLQEELFVPDAAIAVARRHPISDPSLLPMVLWQYGLVSLEELDQIFDWMEAV